MKNKWVLEVFIISFILSTIFSLLTTFLSDYNVIILSLIIIIVISIGIIFDMIGVAVLTQKEAPFHSMNSKKIKGSDACIRLIKNSTKVSSVCNDIVGDICGIVSGGLGASLTLYLVTSLDFNPLIVTTLVTSLISALTVGGKAYFKVIATKKSDKIVFFVGKIIRVFYKKR